MREVVFCIFTIMAVSLNGNMATYIKMTNAVCESHNKSWVTIEQCRLRAIRRDMTVLNVNATIHYPATKIDLKFQMLKKANGYKPWLVDAKIDACAFMRKHNHPFAKMLYNWIKDSSTVNHTCPYMGPQSVRGFYIRPEQIPLPLPTGDYDLLLIWFFSDRPQFSINVYFTFTEDLLKQ